MPKGSKSGYSSKPCGNGVAPGGGAGKRGAVKGNASGMRAPSRAKAVRPQGAKRGR
jgi:hypothetical protein